MRTNLLAGAVALFLALIPASALAQDGDTAALSLADAEAATRICMAVVVEGQSFEAALEGKAWTPMDPRRTGSNLATHAWRSSGAEDTFLMRLPNGGCSFGISEGDSEAMHARVLALLAERVALAPVMREEARAGRAERSAYCGDGEFPLVVSMVASRRSRPHLVFNMFRASEAAPEFCEAPI